MPRLFKLFGSVADRLAKRWQRLKLEQQAALENRNSSSNEDEYERFKNGDISLDKLSLSVEDRITDTHAELSDLREDRSLISPEEYRARLAELKETLEHLEARKRWIDDRIHKRSISVEGFPTSGKWARFEYRDADGTITKRTIAMWESRGPYVVGYDRSRKAERTFRQDRISGWVSG